MTSGKFTTVLLDSIIVDREGRQRRELRNIDELAASIAEIGLIHPLVVTQDHVLIAGERRYTALRALGWTSAPVQYVEELDELTLHLIELEENVKREDLPWQDHTLAIEQYHALRKQRDPEWSSSKTADAIGLNESTVRKHLAVAKQIAEPAIASAAKFSVAHGLATRRAERAQRTAVKELEPALLALTSTNPDEPEAPPPPPERAASLFHTDFHTFASEYEGEPFNFLHCDFPYGINFDKAPGQGAVKDYIDYADSPDVYFALISKLLEEQDRLLDPSAHCLFWLSMKFYTETVALFQGAGWSVNPTPLVWHRSDNKGILPDPQRGPRQVYEVALLMSRGDRKVVRAVSNLVAASTTKEYHQSEKPYKVLEHFFRMLVDDSTVMLDPTCGSGMAVRVAEDAGAHRAVGLEREQEFYLRACDNLKMEG